ncbi:hypothetical protein V8C34DRAFT_280891 [Trichoderma compactum]
MDATLDTQRIQFASIILGQPLDSTQSLIYSQTRTQIRQHAMRAAFRAKVTPLPGDQAPTTPALQPQSMLTGEFRSRPYSKIRRAKRAQSIREIRDDRSEERVASATSKACIAPALDAGKTDLFHTLPVKIGPLQEHFLNMIPITFYMQNPEYFPLPAFADAALLHALFALTSCTATLVSGRRSLRFISCIKARR